MKRRRNERNIKQRKIIILDKILDDDMVMISYLNFGKVHGAMCFPSTQKDVSEFNVSKMDNS